MRLEALQFQSDEFDEERMCLLFERLFHQELDALLLSFKASDEVTPRTLMLFSAAVRSMKSLRYLSVAGLHIPKDSASWSLLGQTVSECPRLRHLSFHDGELQLEQYMDAFISACKYPPSLRYVKLAASESVEAKLRNFLLMLWSERAYLMTVLVAGATMRRVGEKSICWKIPLDILRRLCAFLD